MCIYVSYSLYLYACEMICHFVFIRDPRSWIYYYFLLKEKKQRVYCGIKCQITKLMCLVFKLWKSFVGKMLYI